MHNREDIRLIALDLDGTLLNSAKELSERNRLALEYAAEKGIEIVPTTGRLVSAMPEVIRSLPFVRYVISVNGAQVVDCRNNTTLYSAEISCERALEVMRYCDTLPVIYDCYQDGRGWMTQTMYDAAEQYATDPHVLALIRNVRVPVPDLKRLVAERGRSVQKIQMFFRTVKQRVEMMPVLHTVFPDLLLTSSNEKNIEINHPRANKGDALRFLCAQLGFEAAQAMSFGDGTNDISMLKAAGIGVVMQNASDEVKQAADWQTLCCDADGVAAAIEKFIR